MEENSFMKSFRLSFDVRGGLYMFPIVMLLDRLPPFIYHYHLSWFAMTAIAGSILHCLAAQNNGQIPDKTDLISGVGDVRGWNVWKCIG